MTTQERRALRRQLGEYPAIIAWAEQSVRLGVLSRAHLTPISQREAIRLVHALRPHPPLPIHFRGRRGRANGHDRHDYRISLPPVPGAGWGHLRVGIVLHELAHILDHEQRRATGLRPHAVRFNHGSGFRTRFAELLKAWAQSATLAPYDAIDDTTTPSPVRTPERPTGVHIDRRAAALKAWATRRAQEATQ